MAYVICLENNCLNNECGTCQQNKHLDSNGRLKYDCQRISRGDYDSFLKVEDGE